MAEQQRAARAARNAHLGTPATPSPLYFLDTHILIYATSQAADRARSSSPNPPDSALNSP